MSSSRPIPGRLRILRHPCLLLGSALGVCLAATAVAWVIIAWTILAVTYASMEGSFPRLEERLGGFHLFIMGAVVFGLMSTVAWVTHMIFPPRAPAGPRRRPIGH
jgi:hypothetical protein